MKTRNFLVLLIAPLICTAIGDRARADILNGTNGDPIRFYQYSDTGVLLTNPLNPPSIFGEDFLDCMTVDATGKIFGVGHFLSNYELFSLSGTSAVMTTPSQLGQATDIEFMWDHRLLATSHTLSGNGLTGVLEFNPTTEVFVQNLIPVAATYLGFSPQEANPSGFKTGTLYVGDDAGTTDRYRLTTGGAITEDTSFSIPEIGNTHFRAGDSTIYMENGIDGDSILRYDSTTGALLGTFLTLPGGKISDFTFGSDNSVFVLAVVGPTSAIYHYSADGTSLGSFPDNFGAVGIAYVSSVPEPTSLLLLGVGTFICMGRCRSKGRFK